MAWTLNVHRVVFERTDGFGVLRVRVIPLETLRVGDAIRSAVKGVCIDWGNEQMVLQGCTTLDT